MLAVAVLLLTATPASATVAPRWEVLSLATPTNFDPTLEPGSNSYVDFLTNIGDASQSGEDVTITDTLPPGVTATSVAFRASKRNEGGVAVGIEFGNALGSGESDLCTMSASVVTCTWPGDGSLPPVPPEQLLTMTVKVALEPGLEGPLQNTVTASGGGAPEATDTIENPIGQPALPFGFSHFDIQARNAAGTPYTQAGGHPYELTTTFAFNTEHHGFGAGTSDSAEQPRDVVAELPPGLIGDPQAIPRCSLAQFQSESCPEESQLGTWWVWFALNRTGDPFYPNGNGTIFNLTPSHGQVARLGLQVAGGLILILTPTVRSGGDYGLRVTSAGIPRESIKAISLTFWGNPADPLHAPYGFECKDSGGEYHGECPDPAPPAAFLTMPSSCTGAPLPVGISADSWLNPGVFSGTETTMPALDGCSQVPFEPRLEARPTTNHADSPSGLDVDLHLPLKGLTDPHATAAESNLRDAVVTLPKGLTVNPSSASGLQGCSEAQVGYKPGTTAPLEFSEAPAQCPDAAKIGTVEVETPLLDHPLPGDVYLAKQGENPFGSLLAIYITIDDPVTGVVVKLAGHVEPGPDGRLTTTFTENPQVPFEDFRLKFFGGALGALRTPPACGAYETTSELTPWSHLEGEAEATPIAHPHDEFQITGSASGSGACPTSPGAQENAPRFHAGTESTQAGAFSPFSLKLVREDGSQELAKIDTTLPPGLTGKLAGISECSDAQLAAASSHSGKEEQASPSCPANTEVGSVDVGAGAGPTPLNVQGKAYLAGPYKGAPLVPGDHHPGRRRPLRPRHRGGPNRPLRQPRNRPDPRRQRRDPPHPRRDPPRRPLGDREDEPPQLHPQPDQLRRTGLHGIGTLDPERRRPPHSALPGRRLPNPRLLAQAGALAQGQDQPWRPPGAEGRPHDAAAREEVPLWKASPLQRAAGQHRPRPGHPAPRRVPRPGPHPERLHADAVRGGRLPGQLGPRPRHRLQPPARQPAEGPVYLMSGFGHKLPDVAADLNGQIRVLLHGKVDTGPGGGIRNTFEVVPDAPVSRFTLSLKGGAKGLIVNSESLCAKPQRAVADFTAQNGKVSDTEPAMKVKCPKARKGRHHGHHKRHRPSRAG